jgi:hypothetical protein
MEAAELTRQTEAVAVMAAESIPEAEAVEAESILAAEGRSEAE